MSWVAGSAVKAINYFNVKDYGAVGDGAADDTAAVRAAVTAAVTSRRGGVVYAPIGTYRITSTITLPDPDGGFQNAISILGDGPTLTVFLWTGPSTGANAVLFNVLGQAYCSYRGFGMRNGTGAGRAGTTGFFFRGDANAGGTTGGSVIFEHVLAAGFQYGMQIGDTFNAISELLFYMPIFNDCGTGLWAGNFNTLDLTFHLLQLSGNAIGVSADTAGCVQFFGGSASHSTDTDFYFNTGSGFIINGFRSEEANRFIRDFTGNVSLQGCMVTASTNVDHISIEAHDLLTIIGCKIYDKITVAPFCSVSITGSYIGNGGDSGDQMIYPISTGNLDLVRFYAFGNRGIDANGFSSRASVFNASNVETKAWTMGTAHP